MAGDRGNKKIEKRAVDIIKKLIDERDYIDHDFNDDDKGISWDGFIKLYHGNIDKKENFDDTISIQIKGRTTPSKRLQEKRIFYIDKRDLENYIKVDGTIFFEVLLKKDGDYKVYCAELLPYILRKLLKERPNSKNQVKIKLKEIKNSNQLERIVRNFSINKKEQKKISENIFNQENLLINNQVSEVRFYDWRTPDESVFGLLGEKKYIYQYDDKNNIINIDYATIFAIEESLKISITNKNREVFYSTANHSITSESSKILFGKAFELDFKNRKFNIEIQGTLEERINQLKFIESLINDKGFIINESFLNLAVTEQDKKRFFIQCALYNRMKKFLNTHKIKKDLNLNNWNSKDINDFLIWIDAIDQHKPIRIKEFDMSTIGSIRINDLKFSIFASKRPDDGFDVYSIWNSDSMKKYEFTYVEDKNKITTQNFFSILNKEAYISDDVNIEEMKKKFEDYKLSPDEENLLNFQVLEVIKAYDFTKKEELLNYAEYLLLKIEKFEEFKDIVFINRAQIYKRKGKLTEKMIETLIEIRDKNEENFYKISANLLIGNLKEANLLFSKLNEEEKQIYLSYPISYFFNN